MPLQNKSLIERIVHAVSFEAIAIAICAPIGAWLLDRSLLQMGSLTIMLSTVAMLWNMAYNIVFDRLWPTGRVKRNLKVRVFHALGFEGGFIVIGLPLVALVMNMSLAQAFMLEIGFFLFFLPYTLCYNWVYDTLRQRWFEPRSADCVRAK
ncbi:MULTISPECIES: multidrug/biocide efflux PACE transporter [unclassified Serratia (in: enterobacteria)]|uniref:multidrug/biocide efflux PACE transporter n=1 Tax=unclassified Serratia (in: enterobacteria) TaxID=2647522 RepID=UPI00050147D9|nr:MULTISPECIES: multidrug/biocide efflux PACE transporter [unclassified Serratia (in: enterobacteria)]KFK92832.1 Na(+)-translocating NADH-quinone reductase subunit E [Serratia sp. Ag2]KFK94043.1 Na(+)-translocating NADH-quinone reductase subunit E [Serratia sp. Ag1]